MSRRIYDTPSPSAIQLKQLCFARFGARYIEGTKEAEGDKAMLGTRCHEIAQQYLVDGTAPNSHEVRKIYSDWAKRKISYYPGLIVSRILKHLPSAGTVRSKNVERVLKLVHRGINYAGKIDYEHKGVVGDLKFTSSLDYAKTKKQLRTDPQRLIYSADRFARVDEDKHFTQWTYGSFDAKRSRVVVQTSKRKQTLRLMDKVIVPDVELMLRATADRVDWTSLPKNFDACDQWPPSGCPYRRECKKSDSKKQKRERFIVSVEKLRNKI